MKKLSQHLQYKHPELSHRERMKLCTTAKVAPGRGARKAAKLPPQQLTLQLFPEDSAEESEEKETQRGADEGESGGDGRKNEGDGRESEGNELERGEVRGRSGEDGRQKGEESECDRQDSADDCIISGEHREESAEEEEESGKDEEDEGCGNKKQKWPTHPLDSKFLSDLRDYITSKHGRSRSKSEAQQICLETGRFLYHSNSSSIDEMALVDAGALDAYLTALERHGASSSTLSAKVARLRVALEFLSLKIDSQFLPEVDRMKTFLKNWGSVYGKEARRLNRERLEDLSETPVNFEGATLFISCPEMRSLSRSVINKAKASQPLKGSDTRSVVIWLAGALMLANHQRPGAVVNATLDEYKQAKLTTIGRCTYKTFYSRSHKTATTGRAKLTASKDLSSILEEYVAHLRPKLAEGPLLFPNKDGHAIDHLSRHVVKLGNQYGINVPTATQSRHDAATAISSAGSAERSAVATMMSHSTVTQERYYMKNKGRQQAAEGYSLMESVRETGRVSGRRFRVPFTSDETETISLYFQDEIGARSAPSIERCWQFLLDHPMDKEAKQVRDKVRNLMK